MRTVSLSAMTPLLFVGAAVIVILSVITGVGASVLRSQARRLAACEDHNARLSEALATLVLAAQFSSSGSDAELDAACFVALRAIQPPDAAEGGSVMI